MGRKQNGSFVSQKGDSELRLGFLIDCLSSHIASIAELINNMECIPVHNLERHGDAEQVQLPPTFAAGAVRIA